MFISSKRKNRKKWKHPTPSNKPQTLPKPQGKDVNETQEELTSCQVKLSQTKMKVYTIYCMQACIIFMTCAIASGFLSMSSRGSGSGSHMNIRHQHSRNALVSRPSGIVSLKASSQDDTETSHLIPESVQVQGVTLKMAFDKTYAVADASELKSERFTCPASLDLVHYLRRNSDCVLVGKGTVVRDDCTLTVRRVDLWKEKEQPVRVVVDSKLQILSGRPTSEDGDGTESDGEDYKMLKDGFQTIVYHSCSDINREYEQTPNPNLLLVEIPQKNGDGIISPAEMIQDLSSKQNIHHVMVEGGPATAIQFLKEGVVDRAIIIRAPVTFIEPVPSGMTDDMLREAGLVLLEERPCGDDVVEYWVKDGDSWPTADVADWPN